MRIDASTMAACVAFTDRFICAIRGTETTGDLYTLMEAVTREMGFRYFALIHHDDLSTGRSDRIDIKDYPAAVAERLIIQRRYRRDPVIRACLFADSAFFWSDLPQLICLDKHDRLSMEIGAREGLNEGVTVPHICLNDCPGSCTFAGVGHPLQARRYLGPAQLIGIFAFQAARRLISSTALPPTPPPRLHPRPRDCVILAGQGYSNKRIARALGLTPRTVDGYLTDARRLFDAHDRTELVVGAVLAGEIGLHELARRQPG